LSQWVADYRLLNPGATREEVLKASLQREISAYPHQVFFTGGGLHIFKNFSKEQDEKKYTIEEGLCHSVNLVFIRLMQEVVNYYIAELGYDKQKILSDPKAPERISLLKEARLQSRLNTSENFTGSIIQKVILNLWISSANPKHSAAELGAPLLKENPAATFSQVEVQAKSRFGGKHY
jgi:hypothetical protein